MEMNKILPPFQLRVQQWQNEKLLVIPHKEFRCGNTEVGNDVKLSMFYCSHQKESF
jgi:hypothetical protein